VSVFPDAAGFRELVSGRRSGGRAALLRALLAVGEVPYALAARLRNTCYDRRVFKSRRVQVPVISVGNVTLGGTGKTPVVCWLGDWLRRRGVRVGLVSRGYKAESGQPNDEALELAQRLPGVPHVQDADRVRGARRAIGEHGCEILVLDDAFQHRRIQRDLDIVLLDAFEPFGFERVFPRGTLREPLSGLRRADVIALSRSDAVDPAAREAIRTRVGAVAPRALWLEISHRPSGLLSSSGAHQDLSSLTGRRVAAFCGIGNPEGFRHTLQSCGYELADFRVFPDHCRYGPSDIRALRDWADKLPQVAAIACTHKDLVKLGLPALGPHPLWAVVIGIEVRAGQAELKARLTSLLGHGKAGGQLARGNNSIDSPSPGIAGTS
jgi:tetraacyldisaccharide 4'-kinase